jgi:hypothetical protein
MGTPLRKAWTRVLFQKLELKAQDCITLGFVAIALFFVILKIA